MADVISGAEPLVELRMQRAPITYRRVVVIGGGCYGSWYAAQLARAVERDALQVREVVVVDRDPHCLVAQRAAEGAYRALPLQIACATWDDYLAEWLAGNHDDVAQDAMVPSPLMPQICLDWLMARAQARWPVRTVRVAPLPVAPPMPWERASPDGRHYVSFATWMCPVNCIEPARCPATRGPRDWSMPPALAAYVAAAEPALAGPVIFHCVHRTYGVGMIDALALLQADAQVAMWGAAKSAAILVGTVSHCHGALGVLEIV